MMPCSAPDSPRCRLPSSPRSVYVPMNTDETFAPCLPVSDEIHLEVNLKTSYAHIDSVFFYHLFFSSIKNSFFLFRST